jgi:hypothetical protein
MIEDRLTVKELRRFINQKHIDENAIVYMERIEDFYFKENGWETETLPDVCSPYNDDETAEFIPILDVGYDRDGKTLQFTPHY